MTAPKSAIKRGQMWMHRPSVTEDNNIQAGMRPVVVVSNDVLNSTSPVVLVVPCTRQVKRNFPTHVLFVSEGAVATAVAEHIKPIAKTELVSFIQVLDDYLMEQINNAMEIALGIKDTAYSKNYLGGAHDKAYE